MVIKIENGFVLTHDGEQIRKNVYIKDGKLNDHVTESEVTETIDAKGLLISQDLLISIFTYENQAAKRKKRLKQAHWLLLEVDSRLLLPCRIRVQYQIMLNK